MAQQDGFVTSSVIEELTRRVVSKVMKKFDKQSAVDEKLQRLEMLLIKIHSTIEVSQKHRIQSTWLLRWQEKLKEGASQGDEVLASFKQRAIDEAARDASQQLGSTSGALSFSRIALSSMARRVRNVTKVLFSSNEDVEELHSTLERLEDLSADTGKFIRLVQREVLAEREKKATKRQRIDDFLCSRELTIKEQDPTKWKKSSLFDATCEALQRRVQRHTTTVVNEDEITYNEEAEMELPAPCKNEAAMTDKKHGERFKVSAEASNIIETAGSSEIRCMNEEATENEMLEERLRAVPAKIREDFERAYSSKMHLSAHCIHEKVIINKEMLEKRLGTALSKISKAVEMADSQDLKDLGWLAQWAAILREAMQEGNAVLGTINANASKETTKFDEANELCCFLHSIERLVDDVMYFGNLFVLVAQISNSQIKVA